MEMLKTIAEHAIAFAVLAGLVLPVLAVRLILAFDRGEKRLVLPSAAQAQSREAAQQHRLRLRRLPTFAAHYTAGPRLRPVQSRAPGLAPRWKGAHRLAVSA